MASQDPLGKMTVSQAGSGLWVAQSDSSGPPHALGLVVAQAPPPPGPTLLLPFEPVVRDGMLAYVTERDLGLRTLGREGVAEILTSMPSEMTLMNLALILRRVARGRNDRAAHLELARAIYEDAPVIAELGRWCTTEGHVIFSEQGLVALVAQAVIHCRPDRHEFTTDEWQGFKRVLLAAGGLLHDDADLGEYREDQPDEWLVYMTQNLLFNAAPDFGSGLARTWRLFGELAVDESRGWTTPLDFPRLVDETGLTITQQLALAFGLYAAIGMDTDAIAILPERWHSVCERVAPGVPPEQVISHIAATPAEMRAELTSDAARRFDPELRWASVPFIEKPFLRLEDGRILLLSPRGIEGWPVDGVHYRLLRAAGKLGGRTGVQHFTSFAGDLTEAATVEMVEDSHARVAADHLGVARVSRARPLRVGGESTDIFVTDGGDVVLIEVSSSRITAQTRLTGSLDALRRDLEKVVVKRVKQLHRTVDALLDDEFPDIPAAEVARIFPVIASAEPMRWTPMLDAYLHREVPGLLRQRGVQPLQFVELEDLEALMSVLDRSSLAGLLNSKVREAGVDADLQQWFHDSLLAPRPSRPPIIIEQIERLTLAMVQQLGLETSAFDRWKAERDRRRE